MQHRACTEAECFRVHRTYILKLKVITSFSRWALKEQGQTGAIKMVREGWKCHQEVEPWGHPVLVSVCGQIALT